MHKVLAAALGALLLLAGSGCGSGSSDGDRHPSLSKDEKVAVASLEKAFTSSATGALTGKEATCVATDFVSTVGLEKLKATKLLTADGKVDTAGTPSFDAETSGKFADALLGCVHYQERLAAETAKSDSTVDESKLASCLDEKLPDSLVKKVLVASQTQAKDAAALNEQGTKAMTGCKVEATKK